MPRLEAEIGRLLREKGLTLGTVESATGGLISHMITNVAGSSDYYVGSVTSYSNDVKIKLVGVKAGTIARYGAVSGDVARQMAAGGRRVLGADVCVADTGIAGPGGATPGKPVGLFYLGLANAKGTYSRRHVFAGTRLQRKQAAAEAVIEWLRQYLLTGLVEQPVVSCFLESGGRVLILRRSGRVGTYQGKWAAVSGYLDGEPEEQAFTEIEDETGLHGRRLLLVRKGEALTVDDAAIGIRWLVHPFLFHTDKPRRVRTDWESVEALWIDPSEIAQYDTVPGLREALALVWPRAVTRAGDRGGRSGTA